MLNANVIIVSKQNNYYGGKIIAEKEDSYTINSAGTIFDFHKEKVKDIFYRNGTVIGKNGVGYAYKNKKGKELNIKVFGW